MMVDSHMQLDNARAERKAVDAVALARARYQASPKSSKARRAYLIAQERLADVRRFNADREAYAGGGRPA